MKRTQQSLDLPTWLDPEGKPLSCIEKFTVLHEILEELRQLCKDALEDAVLMGCDEPQFRQVVEDLIDPLEIPFGKE